MPEQNKTLPLQSRSLPVASVNADARSIELVWTTGAAVRRYDWYNDRYYDEALSLDPSAVDLTRLNSGAPLLNSHNSQDLADQIGVVERAWLDGDVGRATVRFSTRDDVEPIWQDVVAGIIRNVSVGYVARTYQVEERQGQIPVYTATDWQPYELSMVAIPADAGAGIRSDQPDQGQRSWPCSFITPAAAGPTTRNEEPMPDPVINPAADEAAVRAATDTAVQQALQAERQRGADIRSAVRSVGLADTVADDLVQRGLSVEQASAELIRHLAARSNDNPTRSQTPHVVAGASEQQQRREAITAAVMHRAGNLAALPDNAREFRGLSLPELARYSLEKEGIDVRGLSRTEVVQRSLMSSTDFGIALANTVGRTLRQAYDVAPRTFTRWARKGTLSDFRPATRVQVTGSAILEKVNEHGEIKRGVMNDSGEQIYLENFAKIIGISRKAIINDDMDIFGRIPTLFAQGAVAMESSLVYGVLTGNPNMADGKALFHIDHNNLAASAAAISVASIGAGRAAMRVQQEPSSKQPLNLQPGLLLVPAALETTAQQFISQAYLAAKQADYNPFAGSLELVVEARLDAASTSAWYLLANNGAVDTVEYAYLDGAEGLQTATRDAFASGSDFDGIEVKAWEDFGVKAIDYRGLYKVPGQ